MRKIFTYSTFAILFLLSFSSCVKSIDAVEDLKKSCLYDDKTDYFKKWASVFTEVDTYNTAGTVFNRSYLYPLGYFQLSEKSTYYVLSNGKPFGGNWDVSDSCELVLDPGDFIEKRYKVVKLTADSLTLTRKENNIVYTQHYAAYKCPDESKLANRWDNVSILEEYYTPNGALYPSINFPDGYLKLNLNGTYNRPSNGVNLDGKWQINQKCRLELDKGTSIERAFDIQKLTADSLIIWRKDSVNSVNYLQKYVKHP